jgi:hypothetical protein
MARYPEISCLSRMRIVLAGNACYKGGGGDSKGL